jgi:hypothetical protein
VLLIIESWLPQAEQRPAYIARSVGKVIAILDQLERDVAQYDRLDIGQMRTVGALQFLRLKWATTAKALVGVDPALDIFAGRPLLAAWFAPMARKKIFRQPLLRME